MDLEIVFVELRSQWTIDLTNPCQYVEATSNFENFQFLLDISTIEFFQTLKVYNGECESQQVWFNKEIDAQMFKEYLDKYLIMKRLIS